MSEHIFDGDPARYRSFSLRDYEAGEGGLSGVVLAYGEKIEGFNEVVRAGAFPEGARVRLWTEHGPPVIGAAEMTSVDGVYRFEAEWAPTEAGRAARTELLFLMSRGIPSDVSIGFYAEEIALGDAMTEEERATGADATIVTGRPRELSVVIEGAAPSATIERAASLAPFVFGPPREGASLGAATMNRLLAEMNAPAGARLVGFVGNAPFYEATPPESEEVDNEEPVRYGRAQLRLARLLADMEV